MVVKFRQCILAQIEKTIQIIQALISKDPNMVKDNLPEVVNFLQTRARYLYPVPARETSANSSRLEAKLYGTKYHKSFPHIYRQTRQVNSVEEMMFDSFNKFLNKKFM